MEEPKKFEELEEKYAKLLPKKLANLAKHFDWNVELWAYCIDVQKNFCIGLNYKKFQMGLQKFVIDTVCDIQDDDHIRNRNIHFGDIVAITGNIEGTILDIVWKDESGNPVIYRCQCGEFYNTSVFTKLSVKELEGTESKLGNIFYRSGMIDGRVYFQSFVLYILMSNDPKYKEFLFY